MSSAVACRRGYFFLQPKAGCPRPSVCAPVHALPRALEETADGLRSASQVKATLNAFRGHAPHWVLAWLFTALPRRDSRLDDDTAELARSFTLGPAPSVLRAREALVLAAHDRISTQELPSLFDESTDAARPELAVAAALFTYGGEATAQLSAVIDASPLIHLVFEYAQARLPNLSWV
jgi:hypothetical protein